MMMPQPSRRKHLKSRNGCFQCKKRKIKCDENSAVSCAQCIKSRYSCSFAPPPPVSDSSFSTGALLDLKLLHNFTTKTAHSLSAKAQIQTFFSTDFIELAIQTEYLLHCILALSAFHLVAQYENPESSQLPIASHSKEVYLEAANKHHEIALKGYRHSLSNVNQDSCHSILGCACLLFITALARPAENGFQTSQSNHSTNIELWLEFRLSEWAILIKGLPSIINYDEFLPILMSGPLAPLLAPQNKDQIDAYPSIEKDVLCVQLRHLSEGIRTHCSDDRTIQVCQSSIETLHQVALESNQPNGNSLAFIWPIRVDPDYLVLLEERRPEVLLVFAYYCALLYITSAGWWSKSWPRSILQAVRVIIEEKWIPLLQWPLELVHSLESTEVGISQRQS